MVGAPAATDQIIGKGDGKRLRYQLIKSYGEDPPQERSITRPVVKSIKVAVNGRKVTNWILGKLGMIVFDVPPIAGAKISAGFLFDVPVRFASDQLDVSHATFLAGDIPDVQLIEVKESA